MLWQDPNLRGQLFPDFQQGQQAAGEQQTEAVVQKAEDENRRMLEGEPQPPFEQADANHITVHQQLMEQNEFAEEKEDVQNLFVEHVRAEVAIVEGKVKEQM